MDPQQRSVLVKVIVSRDASVRDAIIRATNNQTAVELASLHATDKVQRDIEEVLLRFGFFYERRTNFYANQGHPASRIVSPLYIASGYVNLVLKSPAAATRLKARFMRSDRSYDHVFAEEAPLLVWPAIARILKKTDSVLNSVRPVGTGANERFLKNWRQITALLATARIFGYFSFSAAELAALRAEDFPEPLLTSTWIFVNKRAELYLDWKLRLRRGLCIDICREAAVEYSLKGTSVVEKSRGRNSTSAFPPDFVERVHATLPHQPWKPGVHRDVARQLGCRSEEVSDAIQMLIASGRRNKQKDGIVYASDGSVLAIDETRVPIPKVAGPQQKTP